MAMNERADDGDELGRLFAAIRAEDDMAPSSALMERILVDADREQPAALAITDGPVAVPLDGQANTVSWLALLGGLPGFGGLAMATVAGIVIGYADLTAVSDAASLVGLEIGSYDVSDFYGTLPTVAEGG